MRVSGKVVVVTGAGSGIGRELALSLLSKQARVVGADLNPDALEETRRLAGARSDDFVGIAADVSDSTAVERLPAMILARFGVVDGVINNAGIIQPFVRLQDLDDATIARVLNVNFFGTLSVIRAFLPLLLERPEAHIVNLSSMGGFVPVPGQTVYCAAKAAVKLLSEGLASELDGTNVHVTTVFPGAVATRIAANSGLALPTSRAADAAQGHALSPSKAADIIVRGIERDADRVLVGRDAAVMDAFARLSPRRAARAIARKMGARLPPLTA